MQRFERFIQQRRTSSSAWRWAGLRLLLFALIVTQAMLPAGFGPRASALVKILPVESKSSMPSETPDGTEESVFARADVQLRERRRPSLRQTVPVAAVSEQVATRNASDTMRESSLLERPVCAGTGSPMRC